VKVYVTATDIWSRQTQKTLQYYVLDNNCHFLRSLGSHLVASHLASPASRLNVCASSSSEFVLGGIDCCIGSKFVVF